MMARPILKDDPAGTELAAATDRVEGIASAPPKCYVCDDSNHMACGCLIRCKRPKDDCPKAPKSSRVFAEGDRSFVAKLFGKVTRRRVYSATLIPRKNVNSALHTIEVYVCGKRGVALEDSGCSLTIISKKMLRNLSSAFPPLMKLSQS